jgi:hypothetical protein
MQRRVLACLVLATAFVSTSGAPASESASVELAVSGRVLDMDGEPFVGAFAVWVDVRSSAPEDWMYRLPEQRYWIDAATDDRGHFATTRKVKLSFVYYDRASVLVLPRAHDGSILERDEAVANAFVARGWSAEREVVRDGNDVFLDLGEFAFAPAPVVAHVRFASQHPTVDVDATCLTPGYGSFVRNRVETRTVATNQWIEFRSWSTETHVEFVGSAGPRETLFPSSVECGDEREIVCVPTSSLSFAIDPRLPANGWVALHPIDDGHARRLVREWREASGVLEAGPPRLRETFDVDWSRVPRPVREVGNIPDGRYRVEYWPDDINEAPAVLAETEITAPHVGWIELVLRGP